MSTAVMKVLRNPSCTQSYVDSLTSLILLLAIGIIKSLNFLDSTAPSTRLSQSQLARPSHTSLSSPHCSSRTPMFINTSPVRTSSSNILSHSKSTSSSLPTSVPLSTTSNSNNTSPLAIGNNPHTRQAPSFTDNHTSMDAPLIEYTTPFANNQGSDTVTKDLPPRKRKKPARIT